MRVQLMALAILAFSISVNHVFCQNDCYGLYEKEIAIDELKTWQLLGHGEVSSWANQLSLKESDDSKGVMLLSPEIYQQDVIIRYSVMALTHATVVVTMLSVSDTGKSTELAIPDDYDGNIGLWYNEKENYFFAFNNAPHNRTPFIRKNPNAEKALVMADRNHMQSGIYYRIEIGIKDGSIWLKIDDKEILNGYDEKLLEGGRIAIRLRGTAGFKAGCLIKEMTICSTKK
ncbi:MAG: hypothetical protein H6560_10790 [Lewinellaceae bacterium]|nr:hypothetical protein [Lewinellaceae bacterium]